MGTGPSAPGSWVQGGFLLFALDSLRWPQLHSHPQGLAQILALTREAWVLRNALIPPARSTCRDLHKGAPRISTSSGRGVRGKAVEAFSRAGVRFSCKPCGVKAPKLDFARIGNTGPGAQARVWYLPHRGEECGWSSSCWRGWHCHHPPARSTRSFNLLDG